jgi:hypothetical protein
MFLGSVWAEIIKHTPVQSLTVTEVETEVLKKVNCQTFSKYTKQNRSSCSISSIRFSNEWVSWWLRMRSAVAKIRQVSCQPLFLTLGSSCSPRVRVIDRVEVWRPRWPFSRSAVTYSTIRKVLVFILLHASSVMWDSSVVWKIHHKLRH